MTDRESEQLDYQQPATLEAARARIEQLERQLQAERERRREIEANERCFRELAEHIREVIWMTDETGDELVYVCPAYEQIWGQNCDDLYDDPRERLARVHEEDKPRVLEAFRQNARTGNYDEIYRIRRPDGELRWIRDRAFPVENEHGQVYRLAGLALDITDRIEFNDRISNLQTCINTHDRMSVFASLGTGLAHDLSQPLTAARNFIARARMGFQSSPDEIRQTLERADAEISRAVAIIHHLRDFARQGRPTRKHQPLGPIIDDVHQLLDPALRANNIRYDGPSVASLKNLDLPVDEVFIQQILRNLVSNSIDAFDAFDAHENGTKSLAVNVNSDDGEFVDIDISDNGAGVDDSVEVFEPFATTKPDGVGLGLAVSRTLARSHGGDLLLASRGHASANGAENARTVFTLRLPRH